MIEMKGRDNTDSVPWLWNGHGVSAFVLCSENLLLWIESPGSAGIFSGSLLPRNLHNLTDTGD
jgi:hypothetical protein